LASSNLNTSITETFAWNARGMTHHVDQLGQTNFYGYDELGRKTAETNANAEAVRFTYSPGGDLLTLTDGKNQVTTWKYDDFGRVTNKFDANSTLILSYKYDANGRLTNRWSVGKGNTF
jgi:YD repeat-containing protein